MKKLIYLLCFLSLAACGQVKTVVEVTNPLDHDRMESMAEVEVSLLRIMPDGGESYVIADENGDIIPSQLTYDGKLVFQPGLKANETKRFTVAAGIALEYDMRTCGRAYPERYDDFAWENDRVAFRIYGPALKPIDGPSNGIDAWYKRTNALILDKWYADDLAGKSSYHHDSGEGLDDYKVGRTLGAGAMAPYAEGCLWLNENYAQAELLEHGPLRTTFRLHYNDIEVDGTAYSEMRIVSIDAGSQLSRIIQEYGFTKPIEVAAGFPLRKGEPIETESGNGWLAYSEPATLLSQDVTLGMIMPGREFRIVDQSENADGSPFAPHLLMVTEYTPGEPVVYYTGYAWTKAGMDKEAFAEYLKRFVEEAANPLKIDVKW